MPAQVYGLDIEINEKPARLVFGMPEEQLPLRDWPPGKVRIRFRNTDFGYGFVRSETGIRHFAVAIQDGHFVPCYEQGSNRTS